MRLLRYMKLYRKPVQAYIQSKTREAGDFYNQGMALREIAERIDCSDDLTADLLQRAVSYGMLRKKYGLKRVDLSARRNGFGPSPEGDRL